MHFICLNPPDSSSADGSIFFSYIFIYHVEPKMDVFLSKYTVDVKWIELTYSVNLQSLLHLDFIH